MKSGHDGDGKTELSVDAFMNVLLARVDLFTRIPSTYSKVPDTLGSSCSTKTNVDAEHENELELCFIQFYSILIKSKLSIDSVDHSPYCIRLQSQRTPSEITLSASERVYGLISADSIRGHVPVVRADHVLRKL